MASLLDRALYFVEHYPGSTCKVIAQALRVPGSSLSGLLCRATNDGLLRRKAAGPRGGYGYEVVEPQGPKRKTSWQHLSDERSI